MQMAEKGNSVDFSVIVPAYNAEQTLVSCLESLTAQTVPQDSYEVIVVDDGSTDRTAEIARRFNIRYLFQKNRGPASARNHGVHAAQGRIILFTDSDCVPTPHWIEEMVEPFTDPQVVAVKGSYRTRQRELVARFAQVEFEDRYDMLLRHSRIDMVDSYSAAFRKDAFEIAGGFDESFPKANNEDTDLSYRLSAAGCKMVFKPGAVVYHRHPATLSRYLRVKFWRGYWRMIVYRRHPRKAVADSYTPNVLKIQTMLMALSFILLPISFLVRNVFIWILWLCTGVMVLAIPFSIKAYRRDRCVGVIALWIILLRSMVFAAGSLLGVVQCLIQKMFSKIDKHLFKCNRSPPPA